jgi:hypothetical protein
LLGSALLLLGVVAPLFKYSRLGEFDYLHYTFEYSNREVVAVVAAAVLGFFLVIVRFYQVLWVLGALALVAIGITAGRFVQQLKELGAWQETKLPQFGWGWALLFIGAIFLIAASAAPRALYRRAP